MCVMSLSTWETAQCVCCILWLVMMSINMWKTVCLLCCGIFIESCTFYFSLLVWWHVLVAEELTVNRVYSQNSSDALVRQALSQPWIPSDMTHVPFTQTQPPADYFEVKNNNSGTNLSWKTTSLFFSSLFLTITFSETLPFVFPGKWTQGLKFPLGWWSTTTKTASGPVEFSLPLVHWTTHFYKMF